MQVRKMINEEHTVAISIALALPEWFTKGGINSIKKDIYFQTGLVATEEGKSIGFLTFFVNQGIATIMFQIAKKY